MNRLIYAAVSTVLIVPVTVACVLSLALLGLAWVSSALPRTPVTRRVTLSLLWLSELFGAPVDRTSAYMVAWGRRLS